METINENLTHSLKHLLGICNDGKEGYRNAAENVDAPELKVLMTTYSLQRSAYAADLKTSIRNAGGDPDNEAGGPLGALHRAWIEIKTAFTVNDNKAVLAACLTGEQAALDAYDEVLKGSDVTNPVLRQLLTTQRNGISQALTSVKNLEYQYAG